MEVAHNFKEPPKYWNCIDSYLRHGQGIIPNQTQYSQVILTNIALFKYMDSDLDMSPGLSIPLSQTATSRAANSIPNSELSPL